MLATSVVAQVNTNLPVIPPPATAPAATPVPAPAPVAATAENTTTNAPVKKAVKSKKKSAKKAKAAAKSEAKKSAELPTGPVTLVPGPATVAGENVNLRGQAGLKGEVVGHVKKGDTVTVISEINIEKPKAGEPAQWAKIALPSDTKVWIDSKYVDKSNNTISSKKLNLRGGPGENFSVLGVIEKGATVTSVETKGDWMQIQPPASAFAFVAAGYLKQEPGAEAGPATLPPPPLASTENVPPPAPQPLPPTPTTVAETPTIAPPASNPPAPVPPPPAPETSANTPPPAPTVGLPQPTLAPDETDTNLPPPPPRVVTHEGDVRHSVSPVAPTYFELFDSENDKAIDYLYTTSTNLNLARYDGLHITVTGEEALDARWKDTPVLTIQKIYVLGAPAKNKPMHPHK